MNEPDPKPRVAPPAAYKPPSLPTLAALGALSAATAFLGGCLPGYVKPNQLPPTTDAEAPVDEKAPEEEWEGGVFYMGEPGLIIEPE